MNVNLKSDQKSSLYDIFLQASNESDFVEDPVSLETFLYDENYLKIDITLSPKQMEFLIALDDITKSNEITEAVLQWGKGSGKDKITAILFCRHIYLLLNLISPQKYFGLSSTDHIDLLNVAKNAKQAKKVFFKYLVNLVKSAGYKAFNQFGFQYKTDKFEDEIRFPKNITCYSGNSEQEGLEGFNIYLAVMDEASAFKSDSELRKNQERHKHSAHAIYSVLRKSISSRFPRQGKLVLISYPRFKNDFIQTMYQRSLRLKHVFTSFGRTWEIKLTITREDLQTEYDSDPIMAKAMYECDPPSAKDPFFPDTNLIVEIAQISTLINPWIDEVLRDDFLPIPGATYAVGCDLSTTGDASGFAMGHTDSFIDYKPKVDIDLMKVFLPPPGGQVDLEDIRRLIFLLRSRGFRIGCVLYDQYQSADSIQILKRNGFNAELLSVDRTIDPYLTYRSMVYERRVNYYFDPILIEEMSTVRNINGKKVDHPQGGSKDLLDSVVRIVAWLAKQVGSTGNIMYSSTSYSDANKTRTVSRNSRVDRLSRNRILRRR